MKSNSDLEILKTLQSIDPLYQAQACILTGRIDIATKLITQSYNYASYNWYVQQANSLIGKSIYQAESILSSYAEATYGTAWQHIHGKLPGSYYSDSSGNIDKNKTWSVVVLTGCAQNVWDKAYLVGAATIFSTVVGGGGAGTVALIGSSGALCFSGGMEANNSYSSSYNNNDSLKSDEVQLTGKDYSNLTVIPINNVNWK